MEIKTAEYAIGNTDYRKCPVGDLLECAFIGRSNVGKSSLINMLTGKKGLAMTSSKPGKTLLINHFLINKGWYLVDLPGYGYAKQSKTIRSQIEKIITEYILYREQLVNLFVLIDLRIPPQKIDVEFMSWLGENGIPFSIVFTKADKLSLTQKGKNLQTYKETLSQDWEELPPIFVTSSETKEGKEELLEYIHSIL